MWPPILRVSSQDGLRLKEKDSTEIYMMQMMISQSCFQMLRGSLRSSGQVESRAKLDSLKEKDGTEIYRMQMMIS